MLQKEKSPRKLLLGHDGREMMRAACRFNALLIDEVRTIMQPGVTTAALDQLIHQFTLDHGHTPATLGYMGYPKSCCTSINDVICHGIPDETVLREGDIINVDVTSVVNGWFGDQSETFIIGRGGEDAVAVLRRPPLIACTWPSKRCFLVVPVSTIGDTIVAEAHRAASRWFVNTLGTVWASIPPATQHSPLSRSQVATAALATWHVFYCRTDDQRRDAQFTRLDKKDGWTVRARDQKLSAQFEHTVLMTETGPEILTLTQHGPQKGDRF